MYSLPPFWLLTYAMIGLQHTCGDNASTWEWYTATCYQLDKRLLACSFLELQLPNTVKENAGSAKWDSKAKKLVVTLKVVRQQLGSGTAQSSSVAQGI